MTQKFWPNDKKFLSGNGTATTPGLLARARLPRPKLAVCCWTARPSFPSTKTAITRTWRKNTSSLALKKSSAPSWSGCAPRRNSTASASANGASSRLKSSRPPAAVPLPTPLRGQVQPSHLVRCSSPGRRVGSHRVPLQSTNTQSGERGKVAPSPGPGSVVAGPKTVRTRTASPRRKRTTGFCRCRPTFSMRYGEPVNATRGSRTRRA